MNNTIKGKDLMVFVGGKSIALATNHTLEITANTTDTTTKDTGGRWTDSEVSTMGWTVSSENLVSLAGTDGKTTIDIMDLALAGEKVEVIFSLANPLSSSVDGGVVPTGGFVPTSTAGDVKYSGYAIITSVNINAQNGEKASYNTTFTGVGALTKTTLA